VFLSGVIGTGGVTHRARKPIGSSFEPGHQRAGMEVTRFQLCQQHEQLNRDSVITNQLLKPVLVD